MADVKYEIVKTVGVLSKNGDWTKELNVIKWNDGEEKYDIRNWNRGDEDNIKMSKGITITKEEFDMLYSLILTERATR